MKQMRVTTKAISYGMPKLTKLKINKYINKYTKKCKKVHIN